MRRIAIVGQGYVGLPLAMSAWRAGWVVNGFDSSKSRVFDLSRGFSHIEDVSSSTLLAALESKRYQVSFDPSTVSESAIVILCVPTPLTKSGQPDLGNLEDAVRQIAPVIKDDALLINESTSFPGTIRNFIRPLVEKFRSDGGVNIKYATAPERVDPLNLMWNVRNIPRVVAGLSDESTKHAHEFYSSFCETVFKVSSPEVAEMAKLLENTFRLVNIALVNQLVPLCVSLGLDIREVIEAAGTKPYGFMQFYPGAGVGGHCIPIDPLYLLWHSRQLGVDLPLVESANKTNREMPKYVANRLINLAGLKSSDKALILGVAYKSGISDVRESPAHDVASYLDSQGVKVYWSDPLVSRFESAKKWDATISVKGAIVVAAQPGLEVESVASSGVPVLDCTGAYKGIKGVSQL